jgi:MFS family permease
VGNRGQRRPTYLVAAALLLPIKLPAPQQAAGTGILQDLRTGWTFFRSTTWLWVIVLAFGALNALQSGGFGTLGPPLAKESGLGAQGWALIISAQAVGLIATSVVLLRVNLRRPLLLGMIGCAFYSGLMIALGTTSELWVVMIAALVAGAGIEIFGVGWEISMQEHVPRDMLSRVFSYDMLGSFIAIPVGQLVFGPLGAAFGLQQMILFAGVAYLAISLLTLLSRWSGRLTGWLPSRTPRSRAPVLPRRRDGVLLTGPPPTRSGPDLVCCRQSPATGAGWLT